MCNKAVLFGIAFMSVLLIATIIVFDMAKKSFEELRYAKFEDIPVAAWKFAYNVVAFAFLLFGTLMFLYAMFMLLVTRVFDP